MSITSGDIARSLEAVEKRLHSILDDRSSSVIAEAKSMLSESKRRYDSSRKRTELQYQNTRWGYGIKPSNPLRFRETIVDGLRLRVDLFLEIFWSDDPADHPTVLNVVIRVWCLDDSICFRSDWDAPALTSQIQRDTGRVMLRLHFDLANPGQSGPKYHLQVGGKPFLDELHWFPKGLSVPRMLHTPIDLVLASELIAATFYPNEYRDLRREDMWVGARKVSQQHLLSDYIHKASTALVSNASVLEVLWNKSWE